MSYAELADRLGTSKPHVSQLLSGSRNMTLRSPADIADAVGLRPCLKLLDRHETWVKADVVLRQAVAPGSFPICINRERQLGLPSIAARSSNDDHWCDVPPTISAEINTEAMPLYLLDAG